MSKKRTPYPVDGYKIPVNPELSAREHAKAVSQSMIVFMHSMNLGKFWAELAARNPFKFAEMMLNRFPDQELKSLQGTELHIQVINAPITQTPVPGVLASPLTAQVSPVLKLVVGGTPVETIEAEEPEMSEETEEPR